MAVFRIEKNKNYTVMSNHHLRNKELSLKSKGLLSLMLSLPEEWDYTLKGLSIICKEGIDAIRVSIIELEKQGYIERHRKRNSKGQLTNTEYIIHEYPIVTVMAEVLTIDTPYYTIEKKQYPTELVRQRFLEVDYSKLEAFMLEFTKRTEKIHNTKAYLITSLFNIPATADINLSNMVRNDLYGK